MAITFFSRFPYRTKKTFNNNTVLISLSNDAPTFAWILMFEYYISGCPVRLPDILVLYVQVPDVRVTDIRWTIVKCCYFLLWRESFFVDSLARFMFYSLFFPYSICALNGSAGLTIFWCSYIFQTVLQHGLCFMFYDWLLFWLFILIST